MNREAGVTGTPLIVMPSFFLLRAHISSRERYFFVPSYRIIESLDKA